MKFRVDQKDTTTSARTGVLETDHGTIETPVFMPVGTQATVKAVHQHELIDPINAPIILGNTYHLYLRPGVDIIEKAGGLHQFMGWNKPILTDSGGYQVYSLSQRRKIKPNGVVFHSHIDGSKHELSPERVVDIQRQIGADIIMAFDECTPYPCDYDYAEQSMHLTHRWLDRCLAQMQASEDRYGHRQTLAPIVQGSTYPDLRERSATYVAEKDCAINAIGGLSVGEPHDDMYAMADAVCRILPADRPRYLMGVGTPANILECIALGVDMFDCVLPSRNARHGLLYTAEGIVHIKNAKWASDFTPIDPTSPAPTSRSHSKAYLRHLFQVGEYLAFQIATLHNLSFFLWLVGEARRRILDRSFGPWKDQMTIRLTQKR